MEKILFEKADRVNQSGFPADMIDLQPHFSFVLDQAGDREDESVASLCYELGFHLRKIGDYQAAKSFIEKALKIRKKILGEEHGHTVDTIDELGALSKGLGDFKSAKSHYEKSLAICKKVYGDKHLKQLTP